MSLKIGVELLPNKPINQILDLAKKKEKVGVDQIWIADHYHNQNVYCISTLIADRTKDVDVGPGVTNPYVMHPAAISSAIDSIDELSNGRALLGIGAGDRGTLNSIGLDWDSPLTRIKEAVKIIRNLLNSKKLSYEGDFFKLSSAYINSYKPSKIPIYIGAQGPKMLELGGEIGDGVLINGSHPDEIKKSIKCIERGINERSKNLNDDIDISAHTCFSVDEDSESARREAIPVVAHIVSSAHKDVIKRHEISKEKYDKISKLLSKGKHSLAYEEVTERMIDTFSISGNIDECKTRIQNLSRNGISNFIAGSPLGPEPTKALDIIGEKIIGEFK